jgi:hypothetical protein
MTRITVDTNVLVSAIIFGAIITAIAPKVGLPSDLSLILSLEAILTDIYCIVSAIVTLDVLKSTMGKASQLREAARI